MVGAGDRQVEADHVAGERNLGVQRGRAGVVAHPHPHPGDARPLGLLDRHLGRPAHHQVAHAVVAVDDRRGGIVLEHADRRPHVHPTGPDPSDVLRQPEDAVSVGPAQVGRDHQSGDQRCIVSRQPDDPQHPCRKALQLPGRVAHRLVHGDQFSSGRRSVLGG